MEKPSFGELNGVSNFPNMENAKKVPKNEQGGDVIYLKERLQERKEQRKMEIQEIYKSVFNFRENKYAQDLAESGKDKEEQESILVALKKHNGIVLDDGIDLIKGNNLSLENGVAAIIAIVMHDSGKLSSDVLSHHEKGIEYVDEMFLEMEKIDPRFEGVELTDEIRQKIIWAIKRHMNHPHLVKISGGKRFPEPENIVDKVVYDADMLANIGFKNVAFRLNEKNIMEDLAKANDEKDGKKKTSVIEETFLNVMKDVVTLDGVVFTPLAKRMATKRIEDVRKIFDYLKENNVFENIQKEITEGSEGGNELFAERLLSESKKEVITQMKNRLNDEIVKAGIALGVDKEVIDKITI